MVDPSKEPDSKIISIYSFAIKELKRRGIIRTKNITGELEEYIVLEHYNSNSTLPNLQFAPPSTENIDVISRKGGGTLLYQNHYK